jgi:hypothetical protein
MLSMLSKILTCHCVAARASEYLCVSGPGPGARATGPVRLCVLHLAGASSANQSLTILYTILLQYVHHIVIICTTYYNM